MKTPTSANNVIDIFVGVDITETFAAQRRSMLAAMCFLSR
jgi:hypothetical protein